METDVLENSFVGVPLFHEMDDQCGTDLLDCLSHCFFYLFAFHLILLPFRFFFFFFLYFFSNFSFYFFGGMDVSYDDDCHRRNHPIHPYYDVDRVVNIPLDRNHPLQNHRFDSRDCYNLLSNVVVVDVVVDRLVIDHWH